MKTIGKFLVAFGVLMGSLGFSANAKGPTPAPAPRGGQIHNVGGAVKPAPPVNRNKPMVMRPPVQQSGRRSHVHKDNLVHSNCRQCYNLYHLILLNFFKFF